MEPNVLVVGGLFDTLLNGLLGSLKPDLSKLDKVMLKSGIGQCLDSLKPTITGPLDDMLIDAVKAALSGVIDGIGVKTDGHLVVGAAPAVVGAKRSRQEVEDAIRAEGGDPAKFSPWILLALQFAPQLLELIKKLLGK